jgi:arylsulfatase A-like enzyme
VKLIPQLFQEAGYYTSLGSIGHVTGAGKEKGFGKSDYNFEWDESTYNGNDWSGRAEGQPFFAQVMLSGGKARGQASKAKDIPHVRPDDVSLPPYYPRHPVIVDDWADYLDTSTLTDRQVAAVLARLTSDGVLENTVLFFLSDHGVSHARGKQFLYDEGVMIPLIVCAPGRVDAGTVRSDPVLHIDIAATSLEFAGIPLPAGLHSRPLFGPKAVPRQYTISARDRCDETYDRIRCVRTPQFKYIRNGYPDRPHLQPNNYKDGKEILQALREWHVMGKLSSSQELLLFSPTRAAEELYDLAADPWEMNNVAARPEYQAQLSELRGLLDEWIAGTGDRGQLVEPMATYDSDMDVYRSEKKAKKGDDTLSTLNANIEQMKQWWAEGK